MYTHKINSIGPAAAGHWPWGSGKYGRLSQVVILQTAQTWVNAGVCGGLKTSNFNVAEMVLSNSLIYFMYRILNEIF